MANFSNLLKCGASNFLSNEKEKVKKRDVITYIEGGVSYNGNGGSLTFCHHFRRLASPHIRDTATRLDRAAWTVSLSHN